MVGREGPGTNLGAQKRAPGSQRRFKNEPPEARAGPKPEEV